MFRLVADPRGVKPRRSIARANETFLPRLNRLSCSSLNLYHLIISVMVWLTEFKGCATGLLLLWRGMPSVKHVTGKTRSTPLTHITRQVRQATAYTRLLSLWNVKFLFTSLDLIFLSFQQCRCCLPRDWGKLCT